MKTKKAISGNMPRCRWQSTWGLRCNGPFQSATANLTCMNICRISYEYLLYKYGHDQRFVVRAQVGRRVLHSGFKLFKTLDNEASALGGYTVQIPQRGGRRAREAKLLLRNVTVELLASAGRAVEKGSLSVNVVLAEELNAQAQLELLRWVLLTTEAVNSAEKAWQVVRYYELRWRIEDYHKAWKSGVGVERQRFQTVDN